MKVGAGPAQGGEGRHRSRRVARLQERRAAVSESQAAIASHAAGYVRVSTEEQATHGHGLEAQERAIRAFADSQGYELVGVVADPGVSGATRPAERPGFAQLLERAAAGEYSILLVWKFDRLARQIVYAVTSVNELAEKHGVVIRSVTEPIDTSTPMGKTIFAVLAGMAEQERQAITERTWHGRREKAGQGGFAGGGTPYGYRRDLEGGLVVDEHEAAIVRRMFAMRALGLGYARIARELNIHGNGTRRGSPWRHGTVAYILDNPKYQGDVEYLFRWSGAEAHVLRAGAHTPIIERAAEPSPSAPTPA
jgi:site-specific DNA recombinase